MTNEEITEALKDIPILDVAEGLGIEVTQNHMTRCFIHDDKDPSLKVYIQTHSFYCFGCSKGGDVISLVENHRGIGFQEARKWLAERFIPDLLPRLNKHKEAISPEKGELYEKAPLYEMLFDYGRKLLYEPVGKETLKYLLSRGYKEENLRQTEWIYYPPDKKIREYLLSKAPKAKTLISNLHLQGTGGENFSRLALPYRNRRGIITGFAKRATDKREQKYDSTKGLKKHDLFNLCNCRRAKELLMVEGYPDALYFPTLGINNVVAIGQGILSKTHIEGLKSFKVKQVTIAFDNDEKGTGENNTENAIKLLNQAGIDPFVIDPPQLGEYKDPDEYIQGRGVEAFKQLINSAQGSAKWIAKRILSKHNKQSLQTDRGFKEVLDELVAYEGTLTNPIDSRQFKEAIRDNLDISESDLDILTIDHREKKAREQIKTTYGEMLKEGTRLYEEGRLLDLKGYLEDTLKDIRVKSVTRTVTPYTLDDLNKHLQQSRDGLYTGYSDLDKLVTIPQGAITIIAGRPSHGKTTFLMNLCLYMTGTYTDRSFLFFSYEEDKGRIALKFINILSGTVIVETRNLKELETYLRRNSTHNKSIEDGKDMFKTLTEGNRLWIIDEPLSVDDLSDTVTHIAEHYDIGAVFIDYIQKVKIKSKYPTRQIELQKISERILETAKSLSIPIILGCQLGRDKTSDVVRLDNLREAGDIENDANLVLGLFNYAMNKAQDQGETLKDRLVDLQVTILKQREGRVNENVTLEFDRPILTIKDKEGGKW